MFELGHYSCDIIKCYSYLEELLKEQFESVQVLLFKKKKLASDRCIQHTYTVSIHSSALVEYFRIMLCCLC